MPRLPRPQVAGGLYHVTTRGNRLQPIVVDDQDRLVFLGIVGQAVERYGWLCHAYCLMDNHYHLLVETPEPNISAGMQLINGAQAQWFNDAHGVAGHLFERRFRSVLVERDGHLVHLTRYIALNPVRARICDGPERYRWSSCAATLGLAPPSRFLTVGRVLNLFADDPEDARRLFRDFVCAGLDTAP